MDFLYTPVYASNSRIFIASLCLLAAGYRVRFTFVGVVHNATRVDFEILKVKLNLVGVDFNLEKSDERKAPSTAF